MNQSTIGTSYSHRIGIVVPTLGLRPELLRMALRSAQSAGADYLHVVGGTSDLRNELISNGLAQSATPDPGAGLAAAINSGLNSLPEDVRYVNWLGDDDLLTPQSLSALRSLIMFGPSRPPFVFGMCDYIDLNGVKLFTMPTGYWALTLMKFGPQLVSQPACLFDRAAVTEVGMLDESLRWTFDLDLLLKLQRRGKGGFLSKHCASFRWHSSSLSVASRKKSVREASEVRRQHASGIVRIALFMNPAIARFIFLAGSLTSRYAVLRSKWFD